VEQDGRQPPDPARDEDEQRARGLLDVLQRELAGEESLVAGRYLLGERLGAGAHGSVHAALDRLTGERVAVKLLPPAMDLELVRLRSEIAALRLLRLPGVVHLFDEGVDHGRPFLVMERVEGAPFPGARTDGATRWSWEELRGPTLALLDTLARVHGAGLVHRDLKPRNVLVTAQGRPMLLDFGLTVGRALSEDSASDTSALGTPAYAAPEQVRGEPVDARADLYSLGVMLWEALAGRRPHEGPRVSGILRARLAGPAESIERVAPGVPRDVAEMVNALLEVEREQRPRSAVEVGERLRGGAASGGAEGRLAFVGREQELERLLGVARAGTAACVVGRSGTGRTRLLQETAARLEAQGRRVAWLQPGSRPFESLEALVGWLDQAEPASLGEARAASSRAVGAALGAGLVLVADDFHRLDEWSRAVLDARAGEGVVLASVADDETAPGWGQRIDLGPLPETALRGLFAGGDRLQHVHEDAAHELWERTGGLPDSVAAELEGWRRAGLVTPAGAQLQVARAAVDRLCGGLNVFPAAPTGAPPTHPLDVDVDELLAWVQLAWPNTAPALLARVSGLEAWLLEAELDQLAAAGAVRMLADGRVRPLRPSRRLTEATWVAAAGERAHVELAGALAAGTIGRLYHLVAAHDDAAAAREAIVVARAHAQAGRLGEAESALAEGLRAARSLQGAEARDVELALFREWLPVAFGEVTPVAADRVLYEIGRSAWRIPHLTQIERLMRAGIAAYEMDGTRALQAASGLASFPDPALERWRQALRVRAARRCPVDVEARVVAEACDWAANSSEPAANASGREWEGRLRYRQGRFRDAAAAFLTAAESAPTGAQRLSAWLNAGSALLEAAAFDECGAIARRAGELAAACRLPWFEGRAEWLARAAAYRRGDELEPDLELVEALERVGAVEQVALTGITEGAIAWRRGDMRTAGLLTATAARCSVGPGTRDAWHLARALELSTRGRRPDEAETARMIEEAGSTLLPLVGIQVFALLVRAGVGRPREASRLLAEARCELGAGASALRQEILSLEECERELSSPRD
jgi:eukaryotic-like serine/threonine-protein kinase